MRIENLNALVAEKVMGWKHGPKGVSAGLWTGPGCDGLVWNHGPDQWSPSTDPAAMMVVVQRMRELGFKGSVNLPNDSPRYQSKWSGPFYSVTLGQEDKWGECVSANAESLPLAVCLAALRAVAVPESEIEAARGEA